MPSLESSNDRTMTSLTPIPATRAFQNCTIANQDRLLADLITAAVTSEGAVTGGTHVSQARSWRLFSEYLDSIGLSHDYTSIHSPGHNSTRSCALSPWLCGRRGFQDQLMISWCRNNPRYHLECMLDLRDQRVNWQWGNK